MPIDFARGAATQVGTTILRKVAGGIGQVIKSRQPSPTSPIESTTRTKYSTKNLSFPLDIGDDPGVGNHGHYMMFFINEVQPAKLKYGQPQDGAKNGQRAEAQMNVHKEVRESDTKKIGLTGQSVNVQQSGGLIKKTKATGDITQQQSMEEKTRENARQQTNQKGKNTLSIQRAPTTRLDTAIQMYMPPSIQVSYAANYTDSEIGILGEAGIDFFNKVTGPGSLVRNLSEGL